MSKIAIVGGGQAGTVSAIALLEKGHEVSLIESMTPDEMRNSRVRSTAVIWNSNSQYETDLGLGFWDDVRMEASHIRIQFRELDSTVTTTAYDKLHENVNGIDQRTKFPRFMEEFQQRGGNLIIKKMDMDDLEELTATNDLVLIAAGKGEIGKLFKTDPERTVFDTPPRNNCAVVLKNVKEWVEKSSGFLKFEFYNSTGDWFALPFYAQEVGHCRAVVFQAVHGQEMDVFDEVKNGKEVMEKVRFLIKKYAPEDWENFKDAELIDDNAWLKGAITPTVRDPLGVLPSGREVLAIGDTAFVHEPICGCGANSALRQVKNLVNRIDELNGEQLSAQALRPAIEQEYQDQAKYIMDFVYSICDELNPVVWKMLQAAQNSPSIRYLFANMYVDFSKSHAFLKDMSAVDSLIDEHKQELKDYKFVPFERAYPDLARKYAASKVG